ncbi:hypothetical protein FRC11_002739 [Ceratobasidium sp. 423]|nr:hypothetical protein FRC11_002739 [Ceratobasidium sp. 423]
MSESPTSPKRGPRSSFEEPETPAKRPKTLSPGAGALQSGQVQTSADRPLATTSSEATSEADDAQELPLRWDRATLSFHREMEDKLHAQPSALHLSQLIAKHRIGGAYLRTFGPGHVRGIVNLSPDPNERGNLRPLDQAHITRLYHAFTTPGAKNDYPSPIYLAMKASTIAPDCLERMKRCDPRDPGAELPFLELNHPTISRQRELERWIHSQRRDGDWLSAEQLTQLSGELAPLRSQTSIAFLLNGFHHIHALERLEQALIVRQSELINRIKSGDISSEEFDQKRQEIEQDSLLASYRVEVYEAEGLPEELVNWLVRNDDARPAKGMDIGEKTWWTGERILMFMDHSQNEGCVTHEQQLEYAFTAWAKEVAPNRFTPSSSLKLSTEMARSAHLKAEWAGEDPVSRLLTEPFTLEMVLDTRHLISVYTQVVSNKITTGMLQPSGALLACRFWLSARILMEASLYPPAVVLCLKPPLQIFNVSDAEGIEAAKDFIGTTSITADGYIEAIHHWNQLHARPQKIPPYLEHFKPAQMKIFDELYRRVWKFDHMTRDMQWGKADLIIAVRRVFEAFGTRFNAQPPGCTRVISLAFQLYARLPLVKPESSEFSFYPTGALPTPGLLNRELGRASLYSFPASLSILEYLLDETSPTWTIGSQPVGASHNVHGWYRRPRGLHQIAMLLTKSSDQIPFEHKLHSAICMLSDSRLRHSLEYIHDKFSAQLSELETRCNVAKSQNVKYDVLNDYPPQVLDTHGGQVGLFTLLKDARKFLRAKASDEKLTSQLVNRLYNEHRFLFDLIDKAFWLEVDATQWLTGWNTPQQRRYRNLNSLFGWGMYCRHIRLVAETALEHQVVPHLLQVSLRVAQAQGRRPWWLGIFSHQSEKAPSPVPTEGFPEDFSEMEYVPDQETEEQHEESSVEQDNGRDDEHTEEQDEEETEESADERDAEADTSHTTAPFKSPTPTPPISPRAMPTPDPTTSARSRASSEEENEDIEPAPESPSPRSNSSSPGWSTSPIHSPPNPANDTLTNTINLADTTLGDNQDDVDMENEDPIQQETHASTPAPPSSQPPVGVPGYGSPLFRPDSETPLQHRSLTPFSPMSVDEPPLVNSLIPDEDEALFSAGATPAPVLTAQDSPSLVSGAFDLPRHTYDLWRHYRSRDVHQEVVVQRQALRESVIDTARLCFKTPYGSTFAITGLSSMVASLKDDFACRVAAIFTKLLRLSVPEAMTESMRICATDGLFEHDIVVVDWKSGSVCLELRYTFPKARQDIVSPYSVVNLGTLPGGQDERRYALSYNRYLHAPRGSGLTEAEAVLRGRDAGRILECKISGRQIEPCFAPVITDPPNKPTLPELSNPGAHLEHSSPAESLQKWHVRPQPVPSPSDYLPHKNSPYSTGQIHPAHLPTIPPKSSSVSSSSSETSDESDSVSLSGFTADLETASRVASSWEKAWLMAQVADQEAFLRYISK